MWLKQDGLAVLNYLVEAKGVKRVIIHGESVGGMIATHIASHSVHRDCIKLLVCDKSFGSLDAVASRLMGTWASLGLRYLGQWYTNVVFDYLECKCPKLIFQVRHIPNTSWISLVLILLICLFCCCENCEIVFLLFCLFSNY